MLISDSGLVMDAWDLSVLRDLSSNHNSNYIWQPLSWKYNNYYRTVFDSAICKWYSWFTRCLKIQKTDVLVFSMGSFIAQELTLLHPEKINWLIHYGELCGEKENLPQDTQVLRIQKKSVGFVLLL